MATRNHPKVLPLMHRQNAPIRLVGKAGLQAWMLIDGVVTEAVPFARAGSRFTRDFEDMVGYLATTMDQTALAGWSASTGKPSGASSLAIGSAGKVSTETLRAFIEEAYREIVAALP